MTNISVASNSSTISGTSSDDVFNITGKNDTINGGTGDDVFYIRSANALNSIISGGSGSDTLSFQYMNIGIGKQLSAKIAETGIENITGTSLNDFLEGNSADNVISGGGGMDVIRGMDGNDILQGGGSVWGGNGNDDLYGNDQSKLYGGNGRDTFIATMDEGAHSVSVMDFYHGMDKIKLDTAMNGGTPTYSITNDGNGDYRVWADLVIEDSNALSELSEGPQYSHVLLSVHCTTPAGITLADII